jgi:hypothetical protein
MNDNIQWNPINIPLFKVFSNLIFQFQWRQVHNLNIKSPTFKGFPSLVLKFDAPKETFNGGGGHYMRSS